MTVGIGAPVSGQTRAALQYVAMGQKATCWLEKNSLTVGWFASGNAATEVCDQPCRLVLQAFGHKTLRSFENLDSHKT